MWASSRMGPRGFRVSLARTATKEDCTEVEFSASEIIPCNFNIDFGGEGGVSVPCYSVRDCRLRNAECHKVSVAKIMEHSNSRTKCKNIICSGY